MEDFLNALVAMGHINKEDDKYFNTSEASTFCVQSSPLYIGERLRKWGNIKQSDFVNLTDYLKKGNVKQTNKSSFESWYENAP